jgi:hypothetical protein
MPDLVAVERDGLVHRDRLLALWTLRLCHPSAHQRRDDRAHASHQSMVSSVPEFALL